MAFEEEQQFASSLRHIKSACKVIYYFTKAIFALLLVAFIVTLTCLSASLIAPDTIPFLGSVDAFSIFVFAVYGIISILIIRIIMLILKEVLDNESPFTLRQAKRIKNISFLLFAKVIIDFAFPGSIIPVVNNDHISLSYEVIKSETLILNFNLEFLALAAILFCISLVFQYGVLLQADSKDII